MKWLHGKIPAAVFTCSLLLFFTLLTGCKKDESNPSNTNTQTSISEDDAAEVVAAQVSGGANTYGFSKNIEEFSNVAGGGSFSASDGIIPAGLIVDTTITRSNSGVYTYNFTFRYYVTAATIKKVDMYISMKGTYTFPRVAGSDSMAGQFTIEDKTLRLNSYKITGLYSRIASTTLKYSSNLSVNTNLQMTIDSINVSTVTGTIQNGTVHLTLTGSVSNGKSFSYSAVVVFNGNYQATLTINSKQYQINLLTGTVTKV